MFKSDNFCIVSEARNAQVSFAWKPKNHYNSLICKEKHERKLSICDYLNDNMLIVGRAGEGRQTWATTISPSVPHISFWLSIASWNITKSYDYSITDWLYKSIFIIQLCDISRYGTEGEIVVAHVCLKRKKLICGTEGEIVDAHGRLPSPAPLTNW